MKDSVDYDYIKMEIKTLNEKYKTATSDDDWVEYNSQLNKVGKLMEQYGRTKFNREKNINLVLGLEASEE